MNKKIVLILICTLFHGAYADPAVTNPEQIAIHMDLKPVASLVESIINETNTIKQNLAVLTKAISETNQLKEYIMRLENKIDVLERINKEHNREMLDVLSKRIGYIEKAHKSLHKQKISTKKAIDQAQQMLTTIQQNTHNLIENNDGFLEEPVQ